VREITAFFILFMFSAGVILATSYSAPVSRKVYSSDGKYYVVIDPGKDLQKVYNVSSPGKIYWSFNFSPEMDSWFLSNNGEYVVCVRWKFVRAEDLDKPAVIVFKKSGLRDEFTYNFLVKSRRTGFFETAPHGSFWRVWFESIKMEDNHIEISTHDERKVVISGDDGKLKIWRD